MGFFAPWFLGGMLAVGLPIWVHLLKRHKTDPKLFPSLMFFEQREQSSVRHRRLEYLLLFALRAAMILLLALLFANPFIRRTPSLTDGKKLVVVAVDRSFSMRAADRLTKAKDEALKVLNSLKPGDQAQVIALSGNVQALNALGFTLADRTDRYAEAHALIEQALKASPDDFYILDSMGWVLFKLGKPADALPYLDRAYRLRKDPEVAAHLGEVLWVLGRDRKSTRLNSSHVKRSRMPSSA